MLKNFPAGLRAGKANDKVNRKKIARVRRQPSDDQVEPFLGKDGDRSLASRAISKGQIDFVTNLDPQNRAEMNSPWVLPGKGKMGNLLINQEKVQ